MIMEMTATDIENLQEKIEEEGRIVEKNKGRLEQLKETAMTKFGVSSIAELNVKKKEIEEKIEMETAKKEVLVGKLKEIVPEEIMRQVLDGDY